MRFTIAVLASLLPVVCYAKAPAAKSTFAKAEVKILLDADGQLLAKPKVVPLKNAEKVAKLTSFFPQLGSGESGVAGGWIASVEVKLTTGDGKTVRVSVDPDYKIWSEGKGDWKAKPGLKKFLDGLTDDAKPPEKP